MPHSPSPSAPSHPTGPAYRPRSMPSISRITSRATLVGVPHTAADGCRAAASARLVGPAAVRVGVPPGVVGATAPRARTAVTSDARCMTFGRCSTNGASGTFIDEQNGARACATDRTAYSCSSRSFDDRASWAARRSASSSDSPPRRIVPASTRDVTRPFSLRTRKLGRRAHEAVDGERPARLVRRRQAREQPARVDGLGRVRDDVPRQHDLLERAGADALDALRHDGGPVVGPQRAVVPRDLAGRRDGGARRAAQRVRRGGRQGAGGVDGREPRLAVASADDDARHDEHAARADRVVGVVAGGGVVERERAERDRTRPGQPHLVAHDGARERLVPRGLGVGEPARAPRLEPQRLAPAHDPVATAHPGEGPRVGQEVDEGAQAAGQVGDPGGPHDDARPGSGLCGRGRRFCSHRLPA